MTDEKLIELSRKIHDHCENQMSCKGCKYRIEGSYACVFDGNPEDWNLKELERNTRL